MHRYDEIVLVITLRGVGIIEIQTSVFLGDLFKIGPRIFIAHQLRPGLRIKRAVDQNDLDGIRPALGQETLQQGFSLG